MPNGAQGKTLLMASLEGLGAGGRQVVGQHENGLARPGATWDSSGNIQQERLGSRGSLLLSCPREL